MRALIVVTMLFALEFAGMIWVVRHEPHGVWVGTSAQVAQELLAPVFFIFALYLLLSALIYLYVPPRWDEVLAVILIVILLLRLTLPALQHP